MILSFRNQSGEEVELGFPYEAQRTTQTERIDLLDKYRAHYEFVRQDKHQEHFGVRRIRAVLTEAPDYAQANFLRELSAHPVVLGGRCDHCRRPLARVRVGGKLSWRCRYSHSRRHSFDPSARQICPQCRKRPVSSEGRCGICLLYRR